MEKRGPDSDAETLAFFGEVLGRFSKTREDVKTWFELGELDDYVSFGGKALILVEQKTQNRRKHMSNSHVQIVKDFFAAIGRDDVQRVLALSAKDIEWIIPGEGWPLAGTHRGHAGVQNLLQKANETLDTSYPEPPEFIAQGDRVVVVGFAMGRIITTNKTFEDHWVFVITVRNGKLTTIREYIDTQALARASEMEISHSQ